jgi:hypothetical protein
MRYRGVLYKIDQAFDVHTCWRCSFVLNDRRKSGRQKSVTAPPKSKRRLRLIRTWEASLI